ncbi:hypothetical protein GGI07_004837 [Coemansia sp. Benny D115]|nr:hypothetical protein GGI07_004837 [Coemansia sp. Benny D115]
MNISGLSYLQFLLVDVFVGVYLFLHVFLSRGWVGLFSKTTALRLDPQSRLEGFVKSLGFASCLAGTLLFAVKDGIMARQEMQDVELCQASVYTGADVVPLDDQQLPGIRSGLLLWNIGTAFHLLALGCAMHGWASRGLAQVVGRARLMSGRAGLTMLSLGALGLVAALASHFASFGSIDAMPRARSVARIVSSVFFMLFLVPLVWVSLKLARLVRTARARDAYAAAATVYATSHGEKQDQQQKVNAAADIIRHLVGVQILAWMGDAAALLTIVLLVRVVFFLVFDISFLSPSLGVVRELDANSTISGIAALASSLLPAAIVRLLFPARADILAASLVQVAELETEAAASHGSSAGNGGGGANGFRSHSLSTAGGASGHGVRQRSRAPTTASLAVENHPGLVSEAVMPMPTPVPAEPNASNYLQQIPYIDRNARENSFFSQGPWVQPVTHTFSQTNSLISVSKNPSPQPPPHLEQIVRSNTGSELITVEGRDAILRQIEDSESSAALFNEDSGNVNGKRGPQEQLSRSLVTSTFIPLSSSNVALPHQSGNINASTRVNDSTDLSASMASNMTHPSGPSLRGEALQDPNIDYDDSNNSNNNNAGDKHDSLISAYMRPDNALAMRRSVFAPRASSFVSEDYQYEPAPSGGDSSSVRSGVTRNPFEERTSSRLHQTSTPVASNVTSVFVPEPIEAELDNTEEDSVQALGNGPVLIRKNSKASLRRKNTLERRKRLHKTSDESAKSSAQASSSSATTSQDFVSNDAELDGSLDTKALDQAAQDAEKSAQEKRARTLKSRMSAFNGPPAGTARALALTANTNNADTTTGGSLQRDSSTINTSDWNPKSKHASDASLTTGDVIAHRIQPRTVTAAMTSSPNAATSPSIRSLRLSPESDAASLPSSLFKHSIGSIGRPSIDVFSSVSSFKSANMTNDTFYTPESSIAQIATSANRSSIHSTFTSYN